MTLKPLLLDEDEPMDVVYMYQLNRGLEDLLVLAKLEPHEAQRLHLI